ncbi:hypothetical protein ACQBAT_14860 [Ornithinimicrobium sp. Y1847]|uniref:hypothetical protein n=1 Tax=unclassified Ornithinimicrobium TaxID=2615080 RepID=UPI003B6826D7
MNSTSATPPTTRTTTRGTSRRRRVITGGLLALAITGTAAGIAVAQGGQDDAPQQEFEGGEFAADPMSEVTMIRDCDGESLNRPDSITLTCADGLETLQGLEWFDWGTATAHAEGQLVVAPTAAEGGDPISYPVTVSADGLVTGEAVQDYSRLTITFPGDKPDFEDATFVHELPTVEAASGLDG